MLSEPSSDNQQLLPVPPQLISSTDQLEIMDTQLEEPVVVITEVSRSASFGILNQFYCLSIIMYSHSETELQVGEAASIILPNE
ncbi:unnamed protein product, partial [Didymodactylos carnosus]